MVLFGPVLALPLAGTALTDLAQRVGAPDPALLAVAGAVPALARAEAAGAQRARLLELRRAGTIGDDRCHVTGEELDWAEGHPVRQFRIAGA